MSDWIDKMKQNDQTQEQAQRKHEEYKLHKATVARAKSPAFWASVIEQIQKDAEKLRATFPNDSSRQVDLIKRGESYTLQSRKMPIIIVEMTPNLAGLCINLDGAIKKDRMEQPLLTPRQPIVITVDDNDELIFSWKHHTFTDPAVMAEQLIRSVCRDTW